ncbi:MAG: methionine adenosyltransferase [Candidatus Coatesbacteria bacterium]|nr:methionine adenosyltransferase [Candidatus Coatesbacteria bacterium]
MHRKGHFLFTSESVTEGHPDKIADQISDSILDCLISQDPASRVACETLVTTGLAFVAGEITTNAYCDVPNTVRNVIKEIGYTNAQFGYDYETCAVVVSIDEQSKDIAMGVDEGAGHSQGAGDQGMMFGFATTDTPELMPMPILLAHKLTQQLSTARRSNIVNWLRPDGKSQVTIEYEDWKPKCVKTVVISTQHNPEPTHKEIEEAMIEEVIKKVIPKEMLAKDIKYYINPTGRFVCGGPQADCGLTGRKIIVDTYGGMGRHGGGAFSGKDPSKVDRSASYAARWVAKNIVAAGFAEKCELQLAYAIGVAEPVSIMIDLYNTGKVEESKIIAAVRNVFDLTPKGIINSLNLRRPIFRKTAAYGHFGREIPEFTWEQTNKVEELKSAI